MKNLGTRQMTRREALTAAMGAFGVVFAGNKLSAGNPALTVRPTERDRRRTELANHTLPGQKTNRDANRNDRILSLIACSRDPWTMLAID